MTEEEHNGNDGATAGGEYVPEWRRRIERNREVVRDYMRTVEDDRIFLVAFLLMQGLDDRKIEKTLNMCADELAAAKGRIAIGLRLKGVEVRS